MDGPRPAMNGDHAIPPEIVTRHASSLRALARSLALDEHAADDVVQETWLRAFTVRPPTREGLGGWLRRVAEGFALHRLRSDGRRAARERSYARERSEVVHDAGERAETLRLVVDTVLSLEEPYRETVLLRWFENLPPRDIAARTGTTVATVNSRLQRAHARLRERLSARLDRRDLSALLLPIFGWDAGASACAGGAAAAVTILGVTMSTTKLATAGAAAVLGACALWWARSDAGEPAQPPVLAEEGGATRAVLEAPEAHVAPPGAREHRSPALEPEVAASKNVVDVDPYEFRFVVRPIDANGRPRPDVDVYMGLDDVRLARIGRTNWLGELELTWRGSEPRLDVVVQLGANGVPASPLRRVQLLAVERNELQLAVSSSSVPVLSSVPVMGSLLVGGRSIGEVRLGEAHFALDERGTGVFTDSWLVRSERGTGASPNASPIFVSAGGRRSLSRAMIFNGTRVVSSLEVTGTSGDASEPRVATVRGRVVDETGTPASGVLVSLFTPSGGVHAEKFTDEDGTFVFPDVPPGEALLYAGGDALALEKRPLTDLRAGETRTFDLYLRARAHTTLRVLDADGRPAVKRHVEVRRDDLRGTSIAHAKTDEAGIVHFDLGVEPVDVLVRGETPDSPATRVARALVASPGKTIELRTPPMQGRITFHLSSTRDHLIREAGARAWDTATGDGVLLQPVARQLEGATHEHHFELEDLPAGSWTIETLVPGALHDVHGPFVLDGRGALQLGALRTTVEAAIECRSNRQLRLIVPLPSEPTAAVVDGPTAEIDAGLRRELGAEDRAKTAESPKDSLGLVIPGSVRAVDGRGQLAELTLLGAGSVTPVLPSVTAPSGPALEFTARRGGLRVTSGPIVAPPGTFRVFAARDVEEAATWIDALGLTRRTTRVETSADGTRSLVEPP